MFVNKEERNKERMDKRGRRSPFADVYQRLRLKGKYLKDGKSYVKIVLSHKFKNYERKRECADLLRSSAKKISQKC